MNKVSIIGEAVGIQWQGLTDKTQGTSNGLGQPLFIGAFRRGRLDAPMVIHNGNIRAMLGYDPQNPSYIAVQDALDAGVPSVNVVRVVA